MSKKKRILYIIYTNPANYPPLEHSSRIFAGKGWDVVFLGVSHPTSDKIEFPKHPKILCHKMIYCKRGWGQKLHYGLFCLWVIVWTIVWRPSWIYASDVLSSFPANLAKACGGVKILYHEHDTPIDLKNPSWFQNAVANQRRTLARLADICVFPNSERIEFFKRSLDIRREILCVWNCPSIMEVTNPHPPIRSKDFFVLYHGSIVPDRLPLSVVDALPLLPDSVHLKIIGYETLGSMGYIELLKQRAEDIGVKNRIKVVGVVSRETVHSWCQRSAIGISFMPMDSQDINMRHMTGASNKSFDNLAAGLPLLVSNLPDWRRIFVDPGFALAVDPRDPQSIASAIKWCLEHLSETHAMGEQGRKKILSEWNYETQFNKVLEILQYT